MRSFARRLLRGTVGSLPATNGNPTTLAGAHTSAQQSASPAGAFTSLYSFKGDPDGAFPLAPLLFAGGSLYGTTSQGGAATANGDGTVFKITPSGTESVVYAFLGSPDGEFPQGGLTPLGGSLYGTTPNGGTASSGVVYTVDGSGVEKIVYSFAGGNDGAAPTGNLVNLNGTLYGTTLGGGGTDCSSGFGCGTVFKIDPSGTESVLYRFQGGADGANPSAGLIPFKGALYGTTFFGGGTGCNFRGCGTVFKIDTSGAESIVHSFEGGRDGANPSADLVALNNVLYGTTSSGGGSGNNGTVFEVRAGGREHVIHRFKGRPDGKDPEAGLIAVNGTLYGTTFGGGKRGFGTVFSVTPDGTETILHTFTNKADGANPSADLIAVDGVLYGTAKTGGTAGLGTVFSMAI